MDNEKQRGNPHKPSQKTGSPAKGAKKNFGLTSLETLLPGVMGKMGLEKRLKEHSFMQLWFNVCGSSLKDLSRPLYIDHERNLVIGASNAAVAQEISLMRSKLLSELGRMARSLGLELKGIRIDLKNFHQPQEKPQEVLERPALKEPAAGELEELMLSKSDQELLKKISQDIAAENPDPATSDSLRASINKRVMQAFERQLKLQVWRRLNGYPVCQSCDLPSPRLHALHGNNICFTCLMNRD